MNEKIMKIVEFITICHFIYFQNIKQKKIII